MKVSEKDVAYVAGLANLDLTSAERERMLRDLNSILDYIDLLNEVDTSGVEPMAQVSERFGTDAHAAGTARIACATRQDAATPVDSQPTPSADPYARAKRSLPHGEALANAPESDGTFFRVPKVIER